MKKITFIHISDVLLGTQPDQESAWSDERKNEIYRTFEAVVAKARELNVDFLLIAGNLFDHQPAEEELEWLDGILGQLGHTEVIYAAGFCDHLGGDATLLTYRFRSRVYVVGSPGLERTAGEVASGIRDARATMALDHLHFPDRNVDIYGVSFFDRRMDARVVDDAEPLDRDVRSLLVACGGDRRRMPIDWNRLKCSDFEYIALGGHQKYQMKVPGKVYYSGSPESVSSESTGSHGYIYGELSDGGVSVEFVPAAVREYKRIDYQVDNHTKDAVLAESIEELLKAEGRDNIYTICLKRVDGCEKSYDIGSVLTGYRILNIEGECFERSDYSEYSKANRTTELGRLIDRMNMAELGFQDGMKLAVDMMIDVSGLYARSNKKMSQDMYRDSLGQVRSILEAKCRAYESDDAVREYRNLRSDYDVSPDVLDELNSVWAQERRTELEITTLRNRIDELPRQYRRNRIREGIRKALIPLISLGLLSAIMLSALAARGSLVLLDERIVYVILLIAATAVLVCCMGYVFSRLRGYETGGGRKKLSAELDKAHIQLGELCAKRDEIHGRRVELQTLDGRRRDIYGKLTQQEKILDEKLQEIRVMRCALEELDSPAS